MDTIVERRTALASARAEYEEAVKARRIAVAQREVAARRRLIVAAVLLVAVLVTLGLALVSVISPAFILAPMVLLGGTVALGRRAALSGRACDEAERREITELKNTLRSIDPRLYRSAASRAALAGAGVKLDSSSRTVVEAEDAVEVSAEVQEQIDEIFERAAQKAQAATSRQLEAEEEAVTPGEPMVPVIAVEEAMAEEVEAEEGVAARVAERVAPEPAVAAAAMAEEDALAESAFEQAERERAEMVAEVLQPRIAETGGTWVPRPLPAPTYVTRAQTGRRAVEVDQDLQREVPEKPRLAVRAGERPANAQSGDEVASVQPVRLDLEAILDRRLASGEGA